MKHRLVPRDYFVVVGMLHMNIEFHTCWSNIVPGANLLYLSGGTIKGNSSGKKKRRKEYRASLIRKPILKTRVMAQVFISLIN